MCICVFVCRAGNKTQKVISNCIRVSCESLFELISNAQQFVSIRCESFFKLISIFIIIQERKYVMYQLLAIYCSLIRQFNLNCYWWMKLLNKRRVVAHKKIANIEYRIISMNDLPNNHNLFKCMAKYLAEESRISLEIDAHLAIWIRLFPALYACMYFG